MPARALEALKWPALLTASWLGAAALSGWLFAGPQAVALWLPGGVALAALVSSGKRWWPSLLALGVAAAVFEGLRGEPPLVIAMLTLVHVGEPAVPAIVLRSWSARRPASPELGRAAIMLAALPGAMLAAAAAQLQSAAPARVGGLSVGTMLAHVLGTVLVASAAWRMRAGARSGWPARTRRRLLEGATVLAALWILAHVAFTAPPGTSPLGLFPFTVLPFLVWTALRFGSRGASVASLVLSGEALRQALAGGGPFVVASGSAASPLVQTQFFLTLVCFTTLVLAETLEGRDAVIASLRESETALQRERELFRETEAAVHAGSLRVDFTTGRVTASEEARRLVDLRSISQEGLSLDAAVDARVHPEDRARTLAYVAGLRSGERLPAFDFRVRPADGGERTLRAEAGHVIRDTSGQPLRVFGVIEDVTEQRRLEAALRESEDRYRGVFEDSPSVMLVVEPGDGRVVDANPAACAFYGHSRDKMRSLRLFDLNTLPASEVAGLLAQASQGRQASFECRHRAAGGELRDVIEHCGPVRVGAKTLLHSVVHDVTEVRRAEDVARRAMQEAGARLQSVIDATPLGVIVLGDDLRVRLANPAAAQLLGGTDGMIQGVAVEGLLGAEQARVLTAPIIEGESVTGADLEHVRRDGTHVALRVFAAPLRGPEGQVRGSVVLFEDATERRLVDETLQLAQKLETLATVAGGIAHDFNNLLTVVLGHTERALRRLPADSPARSNLERALPAVEQAVALAGQMLTYAGGSRPVVGPVDVGHLIQEERTVLAAAVPAHVTLEVRLPERLPCIEASTDEVRQAITALLANAVEAIGGRRGKVRLSVSTREIAERDPAYSRHTGQPVGAGEYVALEVEDDGCGIRPQNLSRIFDPFFTTKFVGRGLGLAAVLGIVRSHRGGIAVDSTPGRGSRFEIVLPVMGRPAAVDVSAAAVTATIEPSRESREG